MKKVKAGYPEKGRFGRQSDDPSVLTAPSHATDQLRGKPSVNEKLDRGNDKPYQNHDFEQFFRKFRQSLQRDDHGARHDKQREIIVNAADRLDADPADKSNDQRNQKRTQQKKKDEMVR